MHVNKNIKGGENMTDFRTATKRSNQDIRKKLREYGIRQWQLAEHLGIYEESLSRMFRHELPREKKQIILDAIEEMVTCAAAK